MKFYYKSAANLSQLKIRNAEKCDGIEIQMLNIKEDFKTLTYAEQKIHTIHLPFKNKECNIDNIIMGDYLQHFENILAVADQYNAGIVIHLEYSFNELTKLPNKKIINFINLINKYDVKIALENTSQYDSYSGLKQDIIMDVPKVCDYLNIIAGHKKFFPLLDICHLISFLNSSIVAKPYDIKTVIDAYNSEWFNVHLNYGLGLCYGKYHGTTFDSNPKLLVELIQYLNKVNNNCHLILEVYEKDYYTIDNAMNIMNDVKGILNGKLTGHGYYDIIRECIIE